MPHTTAESEKKLPSITILWQNGGRKNKDNKNGE